MILRRGSLPVKVMIGVVLIAAVAIGYFTFTHHEENTVTVHFAETVAIYPGDEVRVLGVPVGNIEKITPGPAGSTVVLRYDKSVKVPADAQALLVSPSLVSVRYIQLVPAYRGGATLQNGAVIPEKRTAIPVEYDDIKTQLSGLASALGPKGADQTGAVGNALNTFAANFRGEGAKTHQAIEQMARAARTFSDGDQDLFATVHNLNDFVGALNDSDRDVRGFMSELDGFSGVLDQNSRDLGLAMDSIDHTMGKVQNFIKDNRSRLKGNITSLQGLTHTMLRERQTFANLAQMAPTVLSSGYDAYNPVLGGIDGLISVPNGRSPAQTLCSAMLDMGGTSTGCESALSPFADMVRTYQAFPVGAFPVYRRGSVNEADPAPPLGTAQRSVDRPWSATPHGAPPPGHAGTLEVPKVDVPIGAK